MGFWLASGLTLVLLLLGWCLYRLAMPFIVEAHECEEVIKRAMLQLESEERLETAMVCSVSNGLKFIRCGLTIFGW